MGTNYYAMIIPSIEEKKELILSIEKGEHLKVVNLVNTLYSESNEFEKGRIIHLGKRSAGWKFLFNPNYERYYSLTKKGLMNFLKRKDIIIYNEYFSSEGNNEHSKYKYVNDPDSSNGEEYLWTAEQFMDMATNWGYPNDWDGESYEKYEKERNPLYMGYEILGDREREEFWIKRGYNPSYYNFYSDGLRWSTCCDFS